MDKETAKEYLPLIQALAEGKIIQFSDSYTDWSDIDDPMFNNPAYMYRIKPEPKRGDLVLVKNASTGDWKEAIFSFKGGNGNYYMQGGTMWKYCIPFDIDKLGKSTD